MDSKEQRSAHTVLARLLVERQSTVRLGASHELCARRNSTGGVEGAHNVRLGREEKRGLVVWRVGENAETGNRGTAFDPSSR
jgi:hypothetical protein